MIANLQIQKEELRNSIEMWRNQHAQSVDEANLYSVTINPSSPRGGCTNPPNGFRPGAQNRTAKG